MNGLKYYRSYKKLQYESTHINKEDSPCHGIENISIFVQQNKTKLRKKYSYKVQNSTQPTVILIKSLNGLPKSRNQITKHMSMPEINKPIFFKRAVRLISKSSGTIPQNKGSPINTKRLMSKYSFKNSYNFFKYININQRNFKVYRCQLTTNNAENCNNCCCSCNSDTMFEVMKDLYDCYKKRNCDNCNCILCCNLSAGERSKEISEPCPKLTLESALKEIAMKGFALPEGKTPSEKKLIDTIRDDLGLPPEPMSQDMREKYTNAANSGLMLPLEGKSPKEKEKILRDLHGLGIPLPLGRTPSEKSLIARIIGKGPQRFKSLADNIQDAKRSGLLVIDYKAKSPDAVEKIFKDVAMRGIPLPEEKDPLLKKLTDKVRTDLGLPPEPKTPSMREKHIKAAEAGFLIPLEGKSPEEKELILQGLANMQIPLPQGRTPSEKALIAKVQKRQKLDEKTASIIKDGQGPVDECICELLAPRHLAQLEKKRKAKVAGLLTPIKGKSKDQKEKILKGLAMQGLPLPKGETASDDKMLKKVRADLGLPPEPKSSAMRVKYAKAVEDGILLPLEGKSRKEKEKILRDLHARGIPLPKGRTPSEKALIKILKEPHTPSSLALLAKKLKEKALKPLEEKKLRDLAMRGLPLPEGKTESDNKLLTKVRAELGLPPEPKTPAIRKKYEKAAEMGLMQPLEGKSLNEKETILRNLANIGIPLPKGRTPSEKALIAKIKGEPRDSSMLLQLVKQTQSERMRKAKDAGLLTPLDGKSPEQQEQILRGLGMMGIALPKGNTDSQNNLINKIRIDLALPPEPKRSSMRARYAKAADKGLLQPLEGKTPKEKEKILRNLIELNIPLPKGRTPSEQALIDKVQREEKSTHSVVALSEKMRAAKAAGLLTPLKGKSPAQKEKILRGLAMNGLPLPEGKTKSEKDMLYKLRVELGLPPEPKTSSIRDKYDKAADAGILVPLEGKTTKEKEKILRKLADAGIPLPKARTPSEKVIIDKIKGEPRTLPIEKMRRAQDAGLLTPLSGKTPSQIKEILRGRANLGIPLPEGRTSSEKNIINNIRLNLGLPPEPKTPAMREKHEKAAAAGLLLPLEGKSPKEKQKILEGLADMGIPLPKGRTDSEKRLIAKVKERIKASKVPEPSITTEKIRQAKAAGLLTPLDKKSPEEKERILRNLVKLGLPLPDGKTPSEKSLINQIKKENKLGKESSAEKIRKAKDAGFLTPLDGKTLEQKEKILRGRAAAGLSLPKGKSRSEKDLINKIKASTGYVSPSPSEAMQKAKAAGLLSPLDGKTPSEKEKRLRQMASAGIPLPAGKTPSEKDMIKKIKAVKALSQSTALKGKTTEQKEKILKGLVKDGVPLPEGKTPSEKQIIDKIRAEMGLPPSPKSPSMREKYKKAHAAGIITPLEGKTLPEKEKILRKLNKEGIPLPVGRTPSEKLLIKTVKAGLSETSTPFEEMTPEKKEKLLRGLIKTGTSLPDAKTPSGKELIKKVRKEMGLPPEPKTLSMKEKMHKAQSAGLITPLEGKTAAQKEKILRDIAKAGIPLPEGRTPSEKVLIRKIEAEMKTKPEHIDEAQVSLSRMKKAKELGLDTSLEGKSPEEKQRILRGLANLSLPLPEGTTKSDIQLINKIRLDLGLPPSPDTSSMKKREAKAAEAGVLRPLEGMTPAEKETLLRNQANIGLRLPEGRTSSEKSLINKIKEEVALSKVPPEKLRKAKEAGLLTPLKGKSQAEKDRIIRGRAEAGLPLPEGRTSSEKSLIKQIRAEYRKTTSFIGPTGEKVDSKPKGSKLFTSLTGKTSAEKKYILHGLAEAGLPLPEGKTSTERALIKRIKGEHKTTKAESRETCERACGCDKKKIKFKHSYVKIRVTSPDISSLCPCPNECISGVKGGLFLENDGINVIIERAGDIHQYKQFGNITSRDLSYNYRNSIEKNNYVTDSVLLYSGDECKYYSDLLTSMYEDYSLKCSSNNNSHHCMTDIPLTYFSLSHESSLKTRQYTNELRSNSDNKICSIGEVNQSPIPSHDSLGSGLASLINPSTITTSLSQNSFDSIIIIKSETSLSFSTSYEEIDSSSAFFSEISDITLKFSSYLTPLSNVGFNSSTIVESQFLTNGVKCCAADTNTSREYIIRSSLIASTDQNILVNRNQMPDDVFQVFPMSSTKLSTFDPIKCNKHKDDDKEPLIIITNLSSDLDLSSVVDDIISKKEFSEASSLFVVVPSDEEIETCCNGLNCSQCSKLLENCNTSKNDNGEEMCSILDRTPSKIEDLTEMKQKFFFEKVPTTIVSSINNKGNLYNYVKQGQNWLSGNKICQITTPNAMFQRCNVVSTDTTQDRPCCCGTIQSGACTTNTISEVITSEYMTQDICSNKPVSQKNNVKQASIISLIQSPTVSVGQISECCQNPGMESPDQILKYPLSTKEPGQSSKKFHSSATKKKKSRNKEQSDRRKYDSPTDNSDEEDMLETTAMTPATENYLICHEQKLKKKKITKWVCGAKEVKIDIACDCKHKNPSFIKTEEESENKTRELTERCFAADPNRIKSLGQIISRLHRRPPVIRPGSLVSIGTQDSPGCILCLSGLPCTAKHNVAGHMTSLSNVHVFQQTPVNIYGHSKSKSTLSPLRSYAAIGSGGIYTQAGSKPTPCCIDAGVGVDFRNASTDKYKSIYLNKQIQKNSNIYPQLTSRIKLIPRYTHRENEVGQNKVTLMKPNITQTTSRMKFENNVFLKQHVKSSWTIEDLIRYYAKFKPGVLQTLISLTSIKKPVVKDMTYNEDRRYEYRPQTGETSQLPYLPQNQEEPSKEAHELNNHPFTGFKFEKHGATLDALTLLKKKDITQQASLLSSSTISRCEIIPCQGRQACHSPEEILQFPFGTPLSEPVLKLKKLLEQNCSPEKVQHIFQLIEAGNLKDIDWEDAMSSTTMEDPPSDLGSSHALECRLSPCEGHPGCHAPDEVLQYPFGTPLSPNLLELKKLIEQNESEEKIKHFFGQLENRKLKNVNSEIPMKGSIDLQPTDPVSASKLTSMSNCNPPSCKGHPGCHLPDEVLQYPFGTPLPLDLVELKKLIEKNESKEIVKELFGQLQASNIKTCETLLKQSNNHPVLKPTKIPYRLPPKQEHSEYQCRNDFFKNPLEPHSSPYLVELKNLLEQNNNPKEVKRIMKQIENGNLRNRNWEWETSTPTNTSPDDSLTSNVVPKSSISIVSSCHSPDEILHIPTGYLPAPLQTLKYVLERYYDPIKVQRLFKQIETGNYQNLDYIGALRSPPELVYVPEKKAPPPMSFCPPVPYTCGKHFSSPDSNIPHDVLQYPYDTLTKQLERLRKILECYQDPKVKRLFEQMGAGGLQNLQQTVPTAPSTSNCTDPCCPAHNQCLRHPFGTFLPKNFTKMKTLIGQKIRPNVQCNNFETLDTCTDFLPDNYQTLESGPVTAPYRSPPYQGRPELPNQVLQHPFRTPLPQNLKELQEVLGHDIDPKKIKQLFEEIEAENQLNLDWKCAMEILTELERDNFDDVDNTPSDSASISQCAGHSIGSEGKNIQGGSEPTPHNIDVGVGVELRNASTDTEQCRSDSLHRQIQKNSNPYPQSAPRTKLNPRYMHRENEVGQNNVMLMTPNITQTASRRKFDNNVFLKQHVKPSWTIDDLIRYYAKFKPEVLQTLISLTSIRKPFVKDMMYNEDSRYVYRQQPAENSQLPYLPQNQGVLSKGSHEPESRPFTGFKIEKPGKILVKDD